MASVLVFFSILCLIITGFPPEIAGHSIHLKNLRTPFTLLVTLILTGLFLHPAREAKIKLWKDKVSAFVSKPSAPWILFAVYGLLFLWQQLTEYFAIEINFIPFGFYDYILYYLFHGRINYTGLLHTYYHLNNIMIFLAPFWYLFKSPLFLTVIYGFIASLAIIPLYGIAKERFGGESVAPFFIAFVYLNYRYLQNVLLMNFSVEIFYPLFVFATLYCAMRGKWIAYYVFLALGLLVKEDSFIYFSAVGLLVCFTKRQIKHGILTVALSLAYFAFLLKVFIPLTHNTVFKEDLNNFEGYGNSTSGILKSSVFNPASIAKVLFGSPAKLRTYFNLLSRLAFIPLFSPTCVLILAPILPLFFHSTGRDTNFIDLRFHYAAAVLPFVFIAFIFGFSNLYRKVKEKWRENFVWVVFLVLLFINGGNYVTQKITKERLKSIEWARSIPVTANLVTHGHLLPYVGYRKYNYYFAQPFELEANPAHSAFSNADYYLIDENVNLYPMEKPYFDEKVKSLKSDPRYELIRSSDGRFLFKRRDLVYGKS